MNVVRLFLFVRDKRERESKKSVRRPSVEKRREKVKALQKRDE